MNQYFQLRTETCFSSRHTGKSSKEHNTDDSTLPGKAFYDLRKLKINELKRNADTHPYPHKFPISITMSHFCKKYEYLKNGERLQDTSEQVAGRILSIRRASSKLYFFDVQGDGTKIQAKVNLAMYDNKDHFADEMSKYHRGDIVGIHGAPCRTKSGELSIDSTTVTMSFTASIWKNLQNHFKADHYSSFLDSITGSMFAHASRITLWHQGQRSPISTTIFRSDSKQ